MLQQGYGKGDGYHKLKQPKGALPGGRKGAYGCLHKIIKQFSAWHAFS
jgi:hypothetical protein